MDSPDRNRPWVRGVYVILLLAVVAAAFSPALRGSFISDDVSLIVKRSDWMQRADGWRPLVSHHFWWNAAGGQTGREYLYRPWVTLSYWLNAQIGGMTPWGFHATNIALHLANTWLVLLLLTPFLGFGAAYVVAALTGLSPLAVTSVGWISGSTDLWATFFTLFFLGTFLRILRGRRWWGLILANIFFFLALLSKEIAIVAPLIAGLLLLAVPEKKNTASSGQKRLWYFATLALPIAALLIVRASISDLAPFSSKILSGNLWHYLPYLPEKVLRTAAHILFPLHYNFFSEYVWSLSAQRGLIFWLGWILLISLVVLLFVGLSKRKLWAVGGLWFGVVLVPVFISGQSFAPIADFYAYSGLAGFWLFVMDGGRNLAAVAGIATKNVTKPLRYLGGGIALLFACLTFVRLPILQTEYALMSYTVKCDPHSALAWTGLGRVHMTTGNNPSALQCFEHAVQCDPNELAPRRYLATMYLSSGDMRKAATHVNVLAQIGGNDMKSLAIVARSKFMSGNCAEAVRFFQQAFRLSGTPTPTEEYNYGLSLYCVGDYYQALSAFQTAVRTAPGWNSLFVNIGNCYRQLGQWNQAEQSLREALRRDSNLSEAWEALTFVYLRQGRMDASEQAAQNFLRQTSNPDRVQEFKTQLAEAGAGQILEGLVP